MASDLDPLINLQERMQERLNILGLTIEVCLVEAKPKAHPDRPTMQVILTIDTAQLGKDVEQAEVDQQFEAMLKGQAEAEREAKIEAMKNRSIERLHRLEGGTE